MYYATDTGTVSVYDTVGAAWTTLVVASSWTQTGTRNTAFNALSPTTTKGDLIVDDGTDPVRVGVGSNGQEWIADSSDNEGIVWRTTTVYVNSDTSTSNTTATDIPGLSVAILANRNYAFDLHLMTDSSVATEANFFSVNGPAAPTAIRFTIAQPTAHASATSTTVRMDSFTAYDSTNTLTAGMVSIVPTNIRGTVENGANAGNFVGRYWTETGGAEFCRVRRGSWMRVWEIP